MIARRFQAQIISKKVSRSSVQVTDAYYSHFFEEEFKQAAQTGWDFTQIEGVGYEKASAIWNFDFTEADLVDMIIKEKR